MATSVRAFDPKGDRYLRATFETNVSGERITEFAFANSAARRSN